MCLIVSPPYSSLFRSNRAGEAAGLSQAAVMPRRPGADTPGLMMACDRQGDVPTGSTAFLSWHQISTETSPGSHRDSFQSSALCFSPAVTGSPGEVSAQRGWRCSRWRPPAPTQKSFPLHSLVQVLKESWTHLHAHQCSLSPPLTFFFLHHKKVFSNPFLGGLKPSGDRVLLRKGGDLHGPQNVA